jgi:hypothetical protein
MPSICSGDTSDAGAAVRQLCVVVQGAVDAGATGGGASRVLTIWVNVS